MILISWDGTRPDYLDRTPLPALTRMRREGAQAERLRPVFPPNTFPSHVSLATGAPVDRHGIVGNSFLDPERGKFRYENDASWLEAEPLWVAAERQGVRAAVFFWVGSETDWRGTGASYRVAPFDSDVPESAKVDQILAWLDLPLERRPRLIMSWWHGADHAGHLHGPNHADVDAALRRQDAQLGRLLAGLDARGVWPWTTLIVVSDHGMAEVEQYVDLAAALAERGLRARIVPAGGLAYVYVGSEAEQAPVRAALAALPGVTAVLRSELDPALRATHPTRTGHVIALVDPPASFQSSRPALFGVLAGGPWGAHGYRPERSDMGAILLALGRGVPAGSRLGEVRALDVAATAAKLLGIDPPQQSEGTPIAGLGVAAGSAP